MVTVKMRLRVHFALKQQMAPSERRLCFADGSNLHKIFLFCRFVLKYSTFLDRPVSEGGTGCVLDDPVLKIKVIFHQYKKIAYRVLLWIFNERQVNCRDFFFSMKMSKFIRSFPGLSTVDQQRIYRTRVVKAPLATGLLADECTLLGAVLVGDCDLSRCGLFRVRFRLLSS